MDPLNYTSPQKNTKMISQVHVTVTFSLFATQWRIKFHSFDLKKSP